MLVKDNERAKEGGHWYERESGKPMYQIVGKNGNLRNTTLRDARTMNLVPSVSGIIKVAASPGLEKWKMQQMMLASLTLPKIDGETEDQYIDRIIADSKETGMKAAERGTAIHASVQNYFEGADKVQYQLHAEAVQSALNEYFGERPWECELSFGSKVGFGGKCDLIDKLGNGIIADVKTKEFTDPSKVVTYDEHLMQLAAYRQGFLMPKARCINIFVSVQEPVQVKIVEWTQEDLDRGWAMFSSLLRYWQIKNNYE
jgi:hypothetical protein